MTEIHLKSKKTKDVRLMFAKEYLHLAKYLKDNRKRAEIMFTPSVQYKLVEAKHKGR